MVIAQGGKENGEKQVSFVYDFEYCLRFADGGSSGDPVPAVLELFWAAEFDQEAGNPYGVGPDV